MSDEQNIQTEAAAEQVEPQTEATTEETTVNVPPELEGIDDEEIVKEVMAEAKAEQEEEPQEEPAEPTPMVMPEEGNAPGPIPYARFKEKVDEGRKKDEEIAQLKKQLEAMKQAPAPQPQQVPQYQPPQYQPPQPPVQQPAPQPQRNTLFTPENMKIINAAIHEEAMQMAQLSQEDMDSLEYMEEDDPRKQRWEYAKEMARGNVFGRIRQAQAMKQAQAQKFLEAHNRSVAEFNEYANQAQQEPDFEEVKNYAVNDFFKALPTETDKEVIAAAYARIERNAASPEDIYLIKNFYTQARNAYHSLHPAQKKTTTNKTEQASKFPRSSQISGSGDAGGGVTVASLEKMLRDMPFDEIDPKYQKMLLGE
jgi:hypothetical protein